MVDAGLSLPLFKGCTALAEVQRKKGDIAQFSQLPQQIFTIRKIRQGLLQALKTAFFRLQLLLCLLLLRQVSSMPHQEPADVPPIHGRKE